MSSSHPLPISNPKAQAQAQTNALTGPSFLKRLSDSLRRLSSRRRPWLELVDRSSFSRPTALSDATTRIRKNISYFRVNYLTVFGSVLAFSLLSHPFSLLTLLSLLAAWLFLYLLRPSDQPLVALNRTFSNGETLSILIVVSLFVIFLTNVGSLLMSASLIGAGILCVHGAFRDPEDLFLDDHELPGSGLFSLISGAASSAPFSAAAPSIVVSHAFSGDSPLLADGGGEYRKPRTYGAYENDGPNTVQPEKSFHGSVHGSTGLVGKLKFSGLEDSFTRDRWEFGYLWVNDCERLARGDKVGNLSDPPFWFLLLSQENIWAWRPRREKYLQVDLVGNQGLRPLGVFG